MATKGEKTKPVLLPHELYLLCHVEEEPLLLQLKERLSKSKTVFEQMNCFGLLKQEISEHWIFGMINRGKGS